LLQSAICDKHMAKATVTSRAQSIAETLLSGAIGCSVALLTLAVTAELMFFALHATHLLAYPYPLDYGEGPLLAQVNLLRAGTPIWRLYGDPGTPPYAVVNYPPVYHMLTALVATLVGDTLLAGRLVSLMATLAALAALWRLTGERRPTTNQQALGDRPHVIHNITRSITRRSLIALRLLILLALLGLPIVREWAVVMRVDMLGLALGLWGLALVRHGVVRRGTLWAALPLGLSLFVKPSLIAAPAAALLWLLLHDWRRALLLGLTLAVGGGLAFTALQLASGGWFAVHILTANNNAWRFDLAHGFWRDQLAILWPLLIPAALAALTIILAGTRPSRTAHRESHNTLLMPLCYTLFGALSAFGIGKVGAYTNYFLEFYAGLIWLAAAWPQTSAEHQSRLTAAANHSTRDTVLGSRSGTLWVVLGRVSSRWLSVLSSLRTLVASLCVLGALLRYYPLWSETYLKPYGMIEQQNPPRVAFGQYSVWKDLQRERAILATFGGINAALNDEVRAAGGPIFTDVPGVAAQAGQLARLQAFEHRQLYDVGAWDQRPLLRDLANGRVPLIVLDYLGNWMTKEMTTLITHRYAQDGSRGAYDLYRPVEPGPPAAADLRFGDGPQLVGYRLALSVSRRPIYEPGETVLLTLEWRQNPSAGAEPPSPEDNGRYMVATQLIDSQGQLLGATIKPLLYDALRPADWGSDVMQHLQPITLPPDLPAGSYHVMVTLRDHLGDLAPLRTLATIIVAGQHGRLLGEQGYFVAGQLLAAWRDLGDYDGPGDPLMPAVPFDGYTLQCFARDCLRLDSQGVNRLPLGELIHLVDAGLPPASGPSVNSVDPAIQRFPETNQTLSGIFLVYWRENGGMARFGPPISGEILRGGRIVQYTRYSRLERPAGGGAVQVGRLGEEFLRLPGGVPYRWPA
jgi:hypothetical protein